MDKEKLFELINLFEDSTKRNCEKFRTNLESEYKFFDFATALLFLQQGKTVKTVNMPNDICIYVHYNIFWLHDPDKLEPIIYKLDYKDIIGLWEKGKEIKLGRVIDSNLELINKITNLCNDDNYDLKSFVKEVNEIIECLIFLNKTELRKILFSGNTKHGISQGLQKSILGGL